MKEQREKLKQLCKKAIELPHFQRGYYGKGKTACNMASAYIAKEMGYDVHLVMGAESHGRYFHEHVRSKGYRYERMN